ncbi:MAG: hypothetical protein IPM39_07525 [Chloroflexi bacterium]|nr:hypothetical protein [Chloroflexota bacterium]
MGRFQSLLPADVAADAVLRQLNLEEFSQTYHTAQIVNQPDVYGRLELLL